MLIILCIKLIFVFRLGLENRISLWIYTTMMPLENRMVGIGVYTIRMGFENRSDSLCYKALGHWELDSDC